LTAPRDLLIRHPIPGPQQRLGLQHLRYSRGSYGHACYDCPGLVVDGDAADGVGKIAKGRGRKSPLTEGTVAEIVRMSCQEKPDDGGTHWTTRLLAKRFGLGKDTIAKVWADHNLKPRKVNTFKVSNDPNFETNLVDVVGLYMNPPKRAVVSASTRRPSARQWTAPSQACRWSPAEPER
jgi:hypothetical protein